jgi:hypothetical protein
VSEGFAACGVCDCVEGATALSANSELITHHISRKQKACSPDIIAFDSESTPRLTAILPDCQSGAHTSWTFAPGSDRSSPRGYEAVKSNTDTNTDRVADKVRPKKSKSKDKTTQSCLSDRIKPLTMKQLA